MKKKVSKKPVSKPKSAPKKKVASKSQQRRVAASKPLAVASPAPRPMPVGAELNARGNGFSLAKELSVNEREEFGVYFHSFVDGAFLYKFL